MSFLKMNLKVSAAAVLCGMPLSLAAASSLNLAGTEYAILPSLAGDQVRSEMSFNAQGGFLVAQDNFVDGNGLGIRARRFTPTLAGMPSSILVNSTWEGDQERPRVAALPNGGAAFVWQGGPLASQRVYARFMTPDSVFSGPEILVSEGGGHGELNAAVAAFPDSSVVVVWSNFGKDGSMQGVFARRFSSVGEPLTAEFQVNQVDRLNQRDASVAVLGNGNFVVVWVSEERRGPESIDLMGRLFDSSGNPLGDEFRVDDIVLPGNVPVVEGEGENGEIPAGPNRQFPAITASPEVVAVAELGFTVAWSQHPGGGWGDWNVYARSFDLNGAALTPSARVNTHTERAQNIPRMAATGNRILMVWTSYAQDGADEGIFGQAFEFPLTPDGGEFRVNTTTISKQLQPAVAEVRPGEFIVSWSAFVGGVESMDVFAQRYRSEGPVGLPSPDAPFVSALSQNALCVTWPELQSLLVSKYLIYLDGSEIPIEAEGGMAAVTGPGWTAGSTHTVEMAFRLNDGRVSPKSPPVAARTWGADVNGDGLPDDWQKENWGKVFPPTDEDTDGDGAGNTQEFLAGTDPTDPASVLRTELSQRDMGLYLDWNTEPGNWYQVQVTSDFKSWESMGAARFAHSTKDTVLVTEPASGRYFRVIRMR